MGHRHGCLYGRALWFCHEGCPLPGPAACADCQEKLRRSPETPRRVIPVSAQVFDRLAEHAAEEIREFTRRNRQA